MTRATKRKTSVTIDAAALDVARDLGLNVSAVADMALQQAVADARRSRLLGENADAFARHAFRLSFPRRCLYGSLDPAAPLDFVDKTRGAGPIRALTHRDFGGAL